MTDNHLMFLVTLPIHYGSMKVRRKVRRGNSFSSERSSERAIKSSGTHPHKFLDKPSGKDEHGDIHTTENKRKTYNFRFKCDFCEKATKITLKHRLQSVDY